MTLKLDDWRIESEPIVPGITLAWLLTEGVIRDIDRVLFSELFASKSFAIDGGMNEITIVLDPSWVFNTQPKNMICFSWGVSASSELKRMCIVLDQECVSDDVLDASDPQGNLRVAISDRTYRMLLKEGYCFTRFAGQNTHFHIILSDTIATLPYLNEDCWKALEHWKDRYNQYRKKINS